MRTSVESLEGNKVKLTVEVDDEEISGASDETFRRLTRDASLPGFRPGKVPRQLLQSKLGPKAIRAEVLNDALPDYYNKAIEEQELDVISQPEIDITSGEESGNVVFDAIVEVRPKVSVDGYKDLSITVPNPIASAEDIDGQIDRMRDNFATLTEIDRPLADHDLVTLDVHGSRDGEPAEGLTADDLVYEVGTGGIVEGIDALLVGKSTNDAFDMDAEDAPGGPAHLEILIKQTHEKVLPDLDDEFASDASEFDTLDELRADLSERISGVKRIQANMAMRELSIDALVGLVEDDAPEVLVGEESQRLLEDFLHRLSHEQMRLEDYLASTGQAPEDFLTEMQSQSIRQVKADLALRALAEAENIEVDESDVDEEIIRLAEQAKQSPADVRVALEQNGRLTGLRSQIKNAKAVAWLTEHIAIVDNEGVPMDREALRIEETEQEVNDSMLVGAGHDHDHDHGDA